MPIIFTAFQVLKLFRLSFLFRISPYVIDFRHVFIDDGFATVLVLRYCKSSTIAEKFSLQSTLSYGVILREIVYSVGHDKLASLTSTLYGDRIILNS